ncbi:Ig-like domain repeat protein [Actinopolymorpha pittospori]|uniref:Repeat protein (TIGR01451 family) n=1 Tax=Actinopolymorpha pittospori TaxID=648752 RepID=A0A927MV85_9ACTN|nr:Ig-like domain repeat protein [Actinopolymorpha pittospori]MBE1603927.1 putative repeat protein (TIGR01451 family) [Actinopolymorpha pittospori]
MSAVLAMVCLVGGLMAAPPAVAAPGADLALAWGYNTAGQLGDGTTTNRTTPVETALPEGVTVTQISAGDRHGLALTSDGRVLAWGSNSNGQLGDGTTTNRTTPVEVALPEGVTVTQVSAGSFHSLAVTSDGRVLAWGSNVYGQLGDGTTTNRTTTVEVALPEGVTVTQVSAGSFHSLAVTSDGRVLAWGYNGRGELGDGTTTDRTTPVEVALPEGVTVTQVSAGVNEFSLAVTSEGRVLAWGHNGYGPLGDGTTTDRATPVETALPEGVTVTQVSAGFDHSIAVTSDGRVLAWGGNHYGQLGDGTTTDRTTPVEVALPEGVTVTQVSAGVHRFSLTATSDGGVLAWGWNVDGQLGDGTTTDRTTPVEVALAEGVIVTQISAGGLHSLALAQPPPRASSSTSLTAEPAEAAPGEEVALTATVTCTDGTPTGTVTFLDGETTIGAAPVGDNGTATLTTTPSEGEHQITARYEGNGCLPSTSEAVTVTITAEPGPGELTVETATQSTARPGERVTYRIEITNTGDTTLTDAQVTDDLSDVRAHSTITDRPHATNGTITPSRDSFTWTGTLAPDESAVITFTVRARKPGVMENTLTWDGGSDRTSTTISLSHAGEHGGEHCRKHPGAPTAHCA